MPANLGETKNNKFYLFFSPRVFSIFAVFVTKL